MESGIFFLGAKGSAGAADKTRSTLQYGSAARIDPGGRREFSNLVVPELFYTIQVIYRRNLEVIPLLMAATVWYLIILSVLSVSQYFIERHYSRGAVRNPPPPVLRAILEWLGQFTFVAILPAA